MLKLEKNAGFLENARRHGVPVSSLFVIPVVVTITIFQINNNSNRDSNFLMLPTAFSYACTADGSFICWTWLCLMLGFSLLC